MTDALFGIFLFALACVESGGDAEAIGKAKELGIIQITPVFVEECNRILGHETFDLKDRADIIQSYEMAGVWFERHCKDMSVYEMARCYKQGPSGYRNDRANWAAHDHATRVNNLYEDMQRKRGVK